MQQWTSNLKINLQKFPSRVNLFQVHQRLKEQLAHFQKTSDDTHDSIRQNIKDIENELDKNRREHDQFNQDINANKVR